MQDISAPMFSHDEYQALHEGAALLDRTAERGRLELPAPTPGYLHGLLTNDIAALSAGAGCYAALLTPQGRMISDMRVSELGDRLLVDLPAATTEAVRQRLADFIFSEDVEVQDVGAGGRPVGAVRARAPRSWRHVGPRSGAAGADWRCAGLGAVERQRRADVSRRPAIVIRSDDYGVGGFEILRRLPR